MSSLFYCFHIKLSNNSEIFLTNSDQNIYCDEMIFYPNSGLTIKYCEFNDSAQNHIILSAIFEKDGIDIHHDLIDAEVSIYLYSNKKLTNFTTYYCESFMIHDLNFEIKLVSIANKYNQPLLQVFSKTCRANFGDDKCQVNKEEYSNIYNIQKITGNVIIISSIDKNNGYYNGGVAILDDHRFQILYQVNNIISLGSSVKPTLESVKFIKLIAGCDKDFETCYAKFNNAINFRGEPLIPNDNFIKI